MSAEDRCSVCKCWKPICRCTPSMPNIQVFKPMWYHDICETPIYIESKRQLKKECKERNVIAARLL
jgi:hypothetical protein